jgi:hypothetical protein
MTALPVLLLVFLHLAAGLPGGTKPQEKPVSPSLPLGAAPLEKSSLMEAALLVSQGQFDTALAQLVRLSPSGESRVWFDWASVPNADRAGYREAIEQTLQHWNGGLAGRMKFVQIEREEGADLTVRFDRSLSEVNRGFTRLVCSDARLEVSGARRTAKVRVALCVPNSDAPHTAESAAHLVGQALGEFIGLARSTSDAGGVMAIDLHGASVAARPSEDEVRDAKLIIEARRMLADYARRKIAIHLAKPKLTVDSMRIDVGDIWRGETARYVFKIRNDGDAPLEIDAKPNCGCAVAKYDRVLQPGAEGKIEAEMQTPTLRGKIAKAIDIKCNDLDRPTLSLQMAANVRSIFSVTPSETPVIGLRVGEKTVQEILIKIDSPESVQITRVACSAKYASLTVDPVEVTSRGAKAYKITVSIDPAAPAGRSAFVISAFTSSTREPQLNITAICEKGIIVLPPAVYLGSIDPQSALPINQVITLTSRAGGLHILKVEVEDPNLSVKQTIEKEGHQYQLQVSYRGGWPTGLIQRRIVVLTDDPQQPRIDIPVVANILSKAPEAGGK